MLLQIAVFQPQASPLGVRPQILPYTSFRLQQGAIARGLRQQLSRRPILDNTPLLQDQYPVERLCLGHVVRNENQGRIRPMLTGFDQQRLTLWSIQSAKCLIQ